MKSFVPTGIAMERLVPLAGRWAKDPAVTELFGRRCCTRTPAGGGNFSTELWERARNTPGWQQWSFKSTDGGWIDDTFVQEARNTMDPILWRQEFEASIESLLGAVYPDFGRLNLR